MPRFIPPKACHSCRDSPGMAQINPCRLGKVTQIHVSRNMQATEHLLVVWAQCYVWCVLSVLFSGRMLIKRGGMFMSPAPGILFQVWPFLWDQQEGAADIPAKWAAQNIQWGGRYVYGLYICWLKIAIASLLTSLCLWQTLWRRVRLYCWCWSGVVSWRQRVEFRLRSLDEPFVACTLEDKV